MKWLDQLIELIASASASAIGTVLFWVQVVHQSGLAGLWAAVKLAWAAKRLHECYAFIDRESTQHDEQMTFLRGELAVRQKAFFAAQREAQQVSGVKS